MHIDPLYTAAARRRYAAIIIRHCKRERACDPMREASAWLRGERGWEEAGAYLAARGFGVVQPCTPTSNAFSLRA